MSATFLQYGTAPVRLCVPGREHLRLFLKLQNDQATRQYLLRYLPLSQKQEEEWLDKANSTPERLAFAIVKANGNGPIGSVGLGPIDWKNRHATTGIAIAREECEKGFGTCAQMLLLSYAFLELGLHSIESHVIGFNDRSRKMHLRCGYKESGRARQRHFRNGQWHDDIILDVLSAEWMPLWAEFQRKFPPSKEAN